MGGHHPVPKAPHPPGVPPPPGARKTPVRLASWNASLVAGAVTIDGSRPLNHREEWRVPRFVERLAPQKLDAVFMQEVITEDRAVQLAEGMEKIGFPHWIMGPFGPGVQRVLDHFREVDPGFAEFLKKNIGFFIGHFSNLNSQAEIETVKRRKKGVSPSSFDVYNQLVHGVKVLLSLEGYSLGDEIGRLRSTLKEHILMRVRKFLAARKIYEMIGSGLAVFSRHPIVDYKFVPYWDKGGVDSWVLKGILKVVCELPDGRKITYGNTHQNQDGYTDSTEAHKKQNGQVGGEFGGEEDPLILGGDFNAVAEEFRPAAEGSRLVWPFRVDEFQMLKTMKKLGLRDAYREKHPLKKNGSYRSRQLTGEILGHTFTGNGPFRENLRREPGEPDKRLDYFFVSRHLDVVAAQVLRGEFEDLSDHWPLVVELLLR